MEEKRSTKELRDQYRAIIEENNLIRIAAVPNVKEGDTTNPRVSKFGGSYPYLPEEGTARCHVCNTDNISCCQLYVPSLPQFIQDYFPADKRDGLLVLSLCPECLGMDGYRCSYYQDDVLDKLVYAYIKNSDYDGFEPRIVESWSETKCFPNISVDIYSTLLTSKFGDYDYDASDELNKENNNPSGTYLGGWPEFVQSDETPDGMTLLLEMEESEAATLMWGDAGTAQLWMSTGEDFGSFKLTWACG